MNGKLIETATIKELFGSTIDGSFPVLIDIFHEGLFWSDNELEQENNHLRLINTATAVRYNGKRYLPSYFSFEAPSEDGTKMGSSSITISAIDQRIIELIRGIDSAPEVNVEAIFTKLDDDTFAFSRLANWKFSMSSVTWDAATAKWTLSFDPAMSINIPKDLGSTIRNPAVYTDSD